MNRRVRRRDGNLVSSQETKKLLAALHPFPSSFAEDSVFTHGTVTELRFSYEYGGGRTYRSGVRFFTVRSFRWVAEGHSKAWHIEAGEDSLVEVENSRWVSELIAAQPVRERHLWNIHHYLVYVGDAGAYEVAAESYEILPNELIDDDSLCLGDPT